MQTFRASLLNAAARDDPLPAVRLHAIAGMRAGQQRVQARTQVCGFCQMCGVAIDDQPLAVGIGHRVAVSIEQSNFGGRSDDMFAQGGRQCDQRQVSADHGMLAAASGQRGADIVRGEKHVRFGGDLFVLLAGIGEPRTAARVVAVFGIVLTADRHQCLIEKQ
ncbi:hypothetical protein PS624_05246 [Pseudomonas fluorescens]|uniref:Uncharacterized protein n=1 Tax=Pseudomonas fluorescens TaxID=294 RepID=A0A5E6XC97_PSEFL|nr:hypothetical protein PS624_05246 [Pseudomonas fluorescens]